MTLFGIFGLHALPYKLLLFATIVFNMALYLIVASRLSRSLWVASWALLLCSYHAALNGLYLDFGTIYDVLGYSFFFGCIAIYIAWVATSRRPIAGCALVAISYILGLCAKETVVTLPAVLLLYNLLLTDRVAEERWHWPLRSGLSIVVCFAAALCYSLGKMSGPDSLARQPLYAPSFTLHQFALTTAHYIRQLFYLSARLPTPTGSLWIVGLMIAAALLLRSKLMLFSAAAIVLTQLPVAFIAPRGGFAIYIATGFWALYAATLVHTAFPFLAKPAWAIGAYLALASMLCFVHIKMKPGYDALYTAQTRAYAEFIGRLRKWNFHIPQDGKVLIANDPFPPEWIGYDPLFLISLYASTTHATVTRLKFAPVAPPRSELGSYDYIIDYDSSWRLLQRPGQPLVKLARLQELADHAPILLLDGFDFPSLDNWRSLDPKFAMRVKSEGDRRLLHVVLAALSPAVISASVDDGAEVTQTAGRPGNVEFALPIPADSPEVSHTVRFQITGAAPHVLFMNAELRTP